MEVSQKCSCPSDFLLELHWGQRFNPNIFLFQHPVSDKFSTVPPFRAQFVRRLATDSFSPPIRSVLGLPAELPRDRSCSRTCDQVPVASLATWAVGYITRAFTRWAARRALPGGRPRVFDARTRAPVWSRAARLPSRNADVSHCSTASLN